MPGGRGGTFSFGQSQRHSLPARRMYTTLHLFIHFQCIVYFAELGIKRQANTTAHMYTAVGKKGCKCIRTYTTEHMSKPP